VPRDLPPTLRESRVTRAEALARTLESEIVGATFSAGQRIGTKQASTADPHAYFAVNWEFHRRVAMTCANAPLQSIYLILSDFLESGPGDLEFEYIAPERVAVHRRLLAAIEDGGQAEIDQVLAEHAALSPLTSDTPP
jgi:DNA-binding GntR family transcriptional regulator